MTTPPQLIGVALLGLALSGCAGTARYLRSAGCSGSPPPGANSFVEPNVFKLVGSYRLVSVNTATGYDGHITEAPLQLAINDTLSRYYIRTLGPYTKNGNRVLAGRHRASGFPPDTVFVEGTRMSVGCPYWMCTDASPTVYRIGWIGRTGFGGRWEDPQDGIAHAVDKRGRRLPNPSGYFCARRIGQ